MSSAIDLFCLFLFCGLNGWSQITQSTQRKWEGARDHITYLRRVNWNNFRVWVASALMCKLLLSYSGGKEAWFTKCNFSIHTFDECIQTLILMSLSQGCSHEIGKSSLQKRKSFPPLNSDNTFVFPKNSISLNVRHCFVGLIYLLIDIFFNLKYCDKVAWITEVILVI